jgi:ABC-type multidrug transport system fused ATPase/permease subunit
MFNRLKKTIQDISPYVFSKKNAWRIGAGFVLTGTGMGLSFLAPYLFGQTVATLTTGAASTTLLGIEFSPLALIATGGVVNYGRTVVSNYRNAILMPVGPIATKELVTRYANNVLKQSADYHIATKFSDHIALLQKCYMSMSSVTTQVYNQIVPTVMEVGVGATLLSRLYGAEVGLGLGGVVILYVAHSIATKKIITDARDEAVKVGFQSFEDTTRAIKNPETSQVFNNEAYELNRLETSLLTSANAEIKALSVIFKVGRWQDLITSLGYLGLSILAGKSVLDKQLTAEDWVIIATYLQQFFGPLSAFGMSVNQVVSGLTDLEAVFKHLDVSSSIVDYYPEADFQAPSESPEIEFKNVSFSYDEKSGAVLNDVSFIARGGKKTGIVAPSGGGKSTCGNLVFRFYDPTEGEILINGQNIKNIGLSKLRSIISIIQQNSILFNESVYNNIAYGGLSLSEGVSEEAVKEVVAKACLTEVIQKLPKGYETEIGERGAKLSGGQGQRLAIARALLKQPKILICDEATSALDSLTEHAIQANIDTVAKNEGLTEIVITHRLSNLIDADNIIVLKDGKVAEQGTHQELITKENGVYATLWQSQNPKKNRSPSFVEFKFANQSAHSHRFFTSAAIDSKMVPMEVGTNDEAENNDVVLNIRQPGQY